MHVDLARLDSTVGILTLLPLLVLFVIASRNSAQGALSLPSLTMITSIVYFYIMPVMVLADGDPGFFGMFMSPMTWTHLAVFLYAVGACLAFLRFWPVVMANPAIPFAWDKDIFKPTFLGLWGIAIAGALTQAALGKLNLTSDINYQFAADTVGELAFLTQTFNLMVPLTLVVLIRERFSWRSLAFLLLILFVFLQVGFRFRILIMLAAIASIYTLQRGYKIGIVRGLFMFAGGIALVNLIGAVRRYGQGIDFTALSREAVDDKAADFNGEFGIVYVLDYMASNPLPAPVWLEPWVVAVARLVPSFLWPGKPTASYLQSFIAGASGADADKAGIAAPQHVEMMLQLGWWGLLPLAFLYYSIACWLMRRVAHTGYETRLAGCALIPTFFGFYMQTRGYFFQIMVDGLFMLGPLFLLTRQWRVAGTDGVSMTSHNAPSAPMIGKP